MSASQSAVRSRAEAVKVSRTFDWLILFTLFFVVLGGYHIHYMLTGGDWDFWTDWKDRRLWVTVAPIVSIPSCCSSGIVVALPFAIWCSSLYFRSSFR
ncbi:MAG: ammonia monooxygenase subunit A [Methylococcaceae bacterium NSO1]|nr:MAG: ammonia monooxygenase subunit A [Methylococcaceae bacterium NSO1]